jgi:2-oxoglutarate ferredoxin oxidoreductase subunit gamma
MLSDRAIDRCACYVDENTTVVYDTSVCTKKPEMEAKEIIGLPANKIANDELSSRVFNIIILGAVIKATNVIELQYVKQAMEQALGKKFAVKPELRELNHKALEMGMSLIQSKAAV